MLSSFKIFISFRQSEINYIDSLFIFSTTSHEIVCFDISVDKSFTMYLFQTSDNLYTDLKSSC